MLAVLLLLMQSVGQQPVFDGHLRQLDVRVPRIETTVHIDGVLDEDVWKQAALLTGFSQYRPVDSRPAEDSTEVLVFYAPDAIYFGIRAYEAHGNVVRATLADPDNVYESKGRVTPSGFEVEVRIPFKSLRYQSGETQDWGIQIVRVTQHTAYEDTWTPVVRASASFLIQSGTLKGLTGMRRGLVMDLSPEFTSRVDGAPAASAYHYGEVDPQLGANLRWGVTQNLSLTGTVNPDFSQVEADVGQVTVNERFAVFFPEKRPFFLEGLEQFDTPNALIYTRRISAPVGGAKLTGKIGGTGVAYIGAVDDNNLSATGDHPIVNLLRLRRDLGTSSTVGLAYTDRIDGNASNRVLGVDARIIWLKRWFTSVQVAGSWTHDTATCTEV